MPSAIILPPTGPPILTSKRAHFSLVNERLKFGTGKVAVNGGLWVGPAVRIAQLTSGSLACTRPFALRRMPPEGCDALQRNGTPLLGFAILLPVTVGLRLLSNRPAG
jgi:hypothetical protein